MENAPSRLKRLEKDQGDAQARQMMTDLESQKKLLNIFRGMANSPAVLDAYLKFSGALQQGKLSGKIREAVALAVAQANRCDYCLSVHTALGKGAGLDDTAIRDARHGHSADSKTQGCIVLARHLVNSKGQVSDADLSAARAAGLDDGDIAEVVANVALNIFTNYFNHVNQTDIDFPQHISADVG